MPRYKFVKLRPKTPGQYQIPLEFRLLQFGEEFGSGKSMLRLNNYNDACTQAPHSIECTKHGCVICEFLEMLRIHKRTLTGQLLQKGFSNQ